MGMIVVSDTDTQLPEVAHGLEDGIVELDGPGDQEGGVSGLGRHLERGVRVRLANKMCQLKWSLTGCNLHGVDTRLYVIHTIPR